jgi:hypothetical protein
MLCKQVQRFILIAALAAGIVMNITPSATLYAQDATEEAADVPAQNDPTEEVPVIIEPPPPTEAPPTEIPTEAPTAVPPTPIPPTEVPAETAMPEVTEVPTQEVTTAPTGEVTPEVTTAPTGEITPEVTLETTAEATSEATVEATPEVTPEVTAEVPLAAGNVGKAVLLAPAANVITNNPALYFDWEAAANATRYDIQIATASNFAPASLLDLNNDTNITATNYTLSPAFLTDGSDDGRYYWRVIAENDAGNSNPSAARVFTFDTTEPPVPVPDARVCDVTVVNLTPTLAWSASPGATTYEVKLYVDGNDVEEVTNPGIPGRSYRSPSPLLATTYRWAVRARDNANNISDYSPDCLLSIQSPLNATPILFVYQDDTPTIRWGDLSWDTGYQVEISNSRVFRASTTVFLYQSGDLASNTTSFTAPHLWDGVWYARVRAKRADGRWGGWSQPAIFAVDVP